MDHTLNRVNCHMQRHLKKHGLNGYTSIALNPLDHYIKDNLRVKEHARYVDDFYFFCRNIGKAKELLEKIKVFKKWIEKGILTKEQAINSYYSWRGHMKRGNIFIDFFI